MRLGYGDVSFDMATPLTGRAAAWLLRSVMGMARANRDFAPLLRITSLHVAGIALLERVRDSKGRVHELERPYLVFMSLFDGSGAAYLADFSVLIPDYIDAIWGNAVRYPGARQAEAMVQWLSKHALTQRSPSEQKGPARYEYHGYRAEDGGGSGLAGRLAPMPMIESAVELMLRLEDAARGRRPTREELLALAMEAL